MSILQAILLAVVEGITEFLPISSTGHIIIASTFMKIEDDPFTKAYTVIVQFGAILSVLVLYWNRFLASWSFYKKILLGFLPAAVIGILVKDKIDSLLGDVEIVGYSLIVGGIFIIAIDHLLKSKPGQTRELDELKSMSALKIGLYQCVAFIPGVSRSAASIIGGLFEGLNRRAAAEFSFFLAVPTLAGATFIKVLKIGRDLDSSHLMILFIGNAVAFCVAILAIKTFIKFLSQRGFFIFGVYRIIVGCFLLVLIYSGWVD